MQQQQGARDQVAVMQQMAGSSDFQPPRRLAGTGKPAQNDASHREEAPASRAAKQDDTSPSRDPE